MTAIIACVVCVCFIRIVGFVISVRSAALSAVIADGLCRLYSRIHHSVNIIGSSNSSELHEMILKNLCYKVCIYVYYIKAAVCSIKYNAWPGFAYKNF